MIEEKKNIKLYQTLKDNAYNEYNKIKGKKEVKLKEIEKILKIYDIDPIINNFYLQRCIECCSDIIESNETEEDTQSSEESKMEMEEENDKENYSVNKIAKKILYYINSLSLSQKRELIKKITEKKNLSSYLRNFLNKDSNIKIYFEILNLLYKDKKIDINNFKKLMNTTYYINITKFHVPLIYGNNQLRYSALIYDINSYFFFFFF